MSYDPSSERLPKEGVASIALGEGFRDCSIIQGSSHVGRSKQEENNWFGIVLTKCAVGNGRGRVA